MLLFATPAGEKTLPRDVLEADKKACRKAGPCGAGEKALYLGNAYVSRFRYLPWDEVDRVYKRVAMSAGGFSGKGVFGSQAYLVVRLKNGRELSTAFKREPDLDAFLAHIEQSHPTIPTHSAGAEKRLAEAEARERARYVKDLTPAADETLKALRDARAVLAHRSDLSRELSAAAKQKRVVDQMNPLWLVMGAVMSVGGIALAAYGLWRLLAHDSIGWYFILGGGAAFFFALSADIVPSRWTSKKAAQKIWDDTVEKNRSYLSGHGTFPVPAQYAHVTVLDRMIRVVREGRAQTPDQALEVVKADLKALNSSVKVSQQEHDEVVDVKPLFLVCDYQN